MIKIFIVDDEDMIREGLQYYVSWEEFGAEVIGSEINGLRALPVILELKPDVVITDVIMPRVDGIELARQLRLNGWNGELIFLSAYQEMTYLKAAFKLAATDFIFKPIQTEELETVIRNVVKLAKDKKEKESMINEANNIAEDMKKILQEKLWNTILFDISLKTSEIVGINKYLKISQKAACLCIILACSKKSASQIIIKQIELWSMEDNNKMMEIRLKSIEESMTCLILAYDNTSSDNDDIKIAKVVQQLKRRLYPYAEDIVVVSGEAVNDISGLRYSFRYALDKLSLQGIELDELKKTSYDNENDANIVKLIKNIVRENLSDIDINTLAEKINMSKNNLSLQFKKFTGKTINNYITEERILKAKKLLCDSRKYIYEIANEVGYKDVVYFSKLFKKATGYLPAEFKERGKV